MSIWPLRADGELTLRRVGALAVVAVSSLVWGRLVLLGCGWVRYRERDFGLSYLTGNLAVSLAIMALRLVSPWSVSRWVIGQLILGLVCWGWLRGPLSAWRPRRRTQGWDAVATLLSLLAASCWVSHLYPQVIQRPNAWIYRPYMENFSNWFKVGVFLLADAPVAVGSPYYAGEPLSLYHYGSYAWPAWVAESSAPLGLTVLASFWFPQMLFSIGLASYQLGRLWFGPASGAWCAWAVLAIPDPTFWADDIINLSWHRYLEASPNFGCSLAAAAVAVTLVTQGRRADSSRLMLAGVAAAYAAALFKFNIVVAVLPVVAWTLLAAGRPGTRWGGGWVGGLFSASVLLALWAGTQFRFAPTFKLDPQLGGEFARWIMLSLPLDRWWDFFDAAWNAPVRPRQIPGRALWLAWASLQWWLPAWVLLAVGVPSRRGGGWRKRAVPLWALVVYLVLGLGLHPNQNGDPFELQHRPFGWVYLLVVVWCAGLAVSWLQGRGARWIASPTLLFVGLLIPWWYGAQTRITAPPTVLAPGLVRASQFVARHTDPDEPLIDAEKDPWLIMGAICQRRTFVCRADDYTFAGQGALADSRLRLRRAVDRLLAATSLGEIAEWHTQHRARWLLVHPDTPLAWPPELVEQHAFAAGGYRVYDLVRLAPAEPADAEDLPGGS